MKNTTKATLSNANLATAAAFIWNAIEDEIPAGVSIDKLTRADLKDTPHWWDLVEALREFKAAGVWAEPA